MSEKPALNTFRIERLRKALVEHDNMNLIVCSGDVRALLYALGALQVPVVEETQEGGPTPQDNPNAS